MTWNIDPLHSAAHFKVQHLGIFWVQGFISGMQGTILYIPEHLESFSVDAVIDVQNLSTGNQMRDEDLLSQEYFDAEEYPIITFKSTNVRNVRNADCEVEGDLTIHGTTRSIVAPMIYLGKESMSANEERIGFQAHMFIHRQDFDMKSSAKTASGHWVVGNEIEITCTIEATAVV